MRARWYDTAAVRVVCLALLFGFAPFVEAAHQGSLSNLANGDFWWHLRTGLGILQSHAMPHSGLYSQSSTLPWMAPSWLYDVLSAIAYRVLDLRVIPLAAIACKFALAVMAFLLAGGLRGRFWPAVLLSAIAQYILINLPPLPMYCSALLFAAELLLLMGPLSAGDVRWLYGLPPLFLLWANMDVQFVIGVFVLLLFGVATVLEYWGARSGIEWLERTANLNLKSLFAVTAASLIATMLTPYGWRLYGVFFAQVTSAANPYFPGFLALRFRSPQDYVLLLLLAASFLALGMRRSRDLFQITLLLLCAFASFHSQRDAWLATLAAVAVLGFPTSGPASEEEPKSPALQRSQAMFAAVLALLLIVAAAVIHFPRSHTALLAKVGRAYPVAAAAYIRDHGLPQPLFNSIAWGGFLTWDLPEYPVAIDGRTDLYGDDFNIQYAKVMNAEAHFSTFAPFNQAATLLLEKNSLMGKALPAVAGFKVVYSDNVAVVLVREPPQP